uniref:C2H2-type domain-containing protein n=1 Tax=Petromyzon marinus TaxID=7757 RepID=S4RZ64_PETMA
RHRGRTESVLYRCPHCPYSTDKAATLIGHQRSHADEKPYKCWVCDEVFANSGDFCSHQRVHMKPFACPKSGKASSGSGDLCSHQSVHMKPAQSGKALAPPPGDVSPDESNHAGEKPYRCNVCGEEFTQSHHLLSGTLFNHEKTHAEEKPYGCAVCGKRFAQSKGLVVGTLHVHKRTHVRGRPFACPTRGKASSGSGSLRACRQARAGSSAFKCWVCDEVFANSGDLCSHQSVHMKPAQSGKAFAPPPGDVSSDKRNHSGEKPYCCNICGEDFTQSHHLLSGTLFNHEKTHAEEKPYGCTACGKRFAQSKGLVMHKRTHAGGKASSGNNCDPILPALEDHMKQHRRRTESVLYQCPYCPYSTDKAATLIGHQRSHADEKPYKCWVCDEVFANSGDYCSHQSMHMKRARRRKSIVPLPRDVSPDKRIRAGERPYHCNVCGVDFTQSQHRTLHKRTHAGGRPFTCPTRGKASSEAGGLRAHRQACAGSSALP